LAAGLALIMSGIIEPIYRLSTNFYDMLAKIETSDVATVVFDQNTETTKAETDVALEDEVLTTNTEYSPSFDLNKYNLITKKYPGDNFIGKILEKRTKSKDIENSLAIISQEEKRGKSIYIRSNYKPPILNLCYDKKDIFSFISYTLLFYVI